MPQVSVFLHKSVADYAYYISNVLDTSRSEVIEDMIKHVRDEDLEGDIWEDFEKTRETYEEEADAIIEGEEEEGSEEGD